MDRENIGECYFCKEPVFASEGQAVKYIKMAGYEFPTHKKCRKRSEE